MTDKELIEKVDMYFFKNNVMRQSTWLRLKNDI